MLPRPEKPAAPEKSTPGPEPVKKHKRTSYTIGERLQRWSRLALFNEGGQFRTLKLPIPFRQLFDVLILSIAEGKRYLGNGFIKINELKHLIPWTLNPRLL